MKIFLQFLPVLCLWVMSSCSSTDPWIGEWETSSGPPSSIILNENGAAIQTATSTDGTWSIYGYWEKFADKENTVKVVFDPQSIELNLNNPIAEVFAKQGLIEFAERTQESPLIMTVSEDGQYIGVKDKPEGFIKISSSAGKYSKVKPVGITKSRNIAEDSYPAEIPPLDDTIVVDTVTYPSVTHNYPEKEEISYQKYITTISGQTILLFLSHDYNNNGGNSVINGYYINIPLCSEFSLSGTYKHDSMDLILKKEGKPYCIIEVKCEDDLGESWLGTWNIPGSDEKQPLQIERIHEEDY